MIKIYCDLCSAEMKDWNRGFEVDYWDKDVESFLVVGAIEVKKRIVFQHREHLQRHIVDARVDVCEECFMKIFTNGKVSSLPSSTGLG